MRKILDNPMKFFVDAQLWDEFLKEDHSKVTWVPFSNCKEIERISHNRVVVEYQHPVKGTL